MSDLEAKLKRLEDVCAKNPVPRITPLLEGARICLGSDGVGAKGKALWLIERAEHLLTIHMWERDPDTVAGEKYRNEQVDRGTSGANKRHDKEKGPGVRAAVNEAIKGIAKRRAKRRAKRLSPEQAHQLWSDFFTALDNAGLGPELAADDPHTVTYSGGQHDDKGKRPSMTRKNFLKRISNPPK